MITGGQAVIFHGEFRTTRDIDLTLGVDISMLEKVKKCLKKTGITILVADAEEFVLRTWVLPCIDSSSGIRVDVTFSFSPFEKKAIDNAVSYELENVVVKYCGAEDLIIHKIFAGREIDLIDVRKILLKKKVDEKYILIWLKKFEESSGENYLERYYKIVDTIK
jgi:hypothetical protein